MPQAGLEPAHPKAEDFESSASTIPPSGHIFLLLEITSAYPSRVSCRFTDTRTWGYGSPEFSGSHIYHSAIRAYNVALSYEKSGKSQTNYSNCYEHVNPFALYFYIWYYWSWISIIYRVFHANNVTEDEVCITSFHHRVAIAFCDHDVFYLLHRATFK